MEVVCVTLEEGFERGQGVLVWPLYEPSGKLQRRRKEDERGKSGGLINRMTQLKDGKGKHHQRRGLTERKRKT